MADALQLVLDLLGGDDVAVRQVAEVELHAGLEAPVERHLVDGDGALALVHRRMEMIGRVEMRAVVGREVDVLDRPALAVRAGLPCRPGKKRRSGPPCSRACDTGSSARTARDRRSRRSPDRSTDRRNDASCQAASCGAPVNCFGMIVSMMASDSSLPMHFWPKSLRCRPSLVTNCAVGHAVVVPGAHDLEAVEQAGALLPGDVGHDPRIFLLVGQRHDGGNILQVHHHEIGAQRIADVDAGAQLRGELGRAGRGGSPNWCRPARPRDARARASRRTSCASTISSASWPPTPLLQTWMSMPGIAARASS